MPRVTHTIGSNVLREVGDVTTVLKAHVVSCSGDDSRLYIRVRAHNPLFPESGHDIFLTIAQVRVLRQMLEDWSRDGEPCY